jgi:hypothetical protein
MKPYIRFVGIFNKFGVLYGRPADFDVINDPVVFKSFQFHLSHIFHKLCLYPLKETIGFLLNLPLYLALLGDSPIGFHSLPLGRFKKETSVSFI